MNSNDILAPVQPIRLLLGWQMIAAFGTEMWWMGTGCCSLRLNCPGLPPKEFLRLVWNMHSPYWVQNNLQNGLFSHWGSHSSRDRTIRRFGNLRKVIHRGPRILEKTERFRLRRSLLFSSISFKLTSYSPFTGSCLIAGFSGDASTSFKSIVQSGIFSLST